MDIKALKPANDDSALTEYVTAMIDDQMFGLPISRVQDVFIPERLTRVPLAPREVAGILNLRGRIVTAIDMRARLSLPPREAGHSQMAAGVDLRGESFGLLIDSIGEVVKLRNDAREPNPVNLDPRLALMALGVYRLEGRLLVVLDVDAVLDVAKDAAAA